MLKNKLIKQLSLNSYKYYLGLIKDEKKFTKYLFQIGLIIFCLVLTNCSSKNKISENPNDSIIENNRGQDTITIHPITWETPSPEGWNAHYKTMVQFPETDERWAKIIMVQTLKCDSLTKGDKYPCGEWDYIWNTFIKVPIGDTTETFSIGSFVTPYGKRLWLGGEDGWEWTYDMTDYSSILKGNRELIVGNNQELLDIKFLFINGIPSRNVLKVENIYLYGNYKYGELADDSVLTNQKINLSSNAVGFKIKSVISGHGHEGPRNCCEWDSKTHTWYMNSRELFRWNVWKDCGNNPIYPQGGTWPFDRAGWCPGTKVDEYEFELTSYVNPGDTINLNYTIQNYFDNGEKKGNLRMSHQLISYGKPNFKNNVEILDIISPSSQDKYSRINPTLSNPRILIRNSGEYNLRSVDIQYGLKRGRKSVFQWSGDLAFVEEEEIVLPIPSWREVKKVQTFIVELKNPNGVKDENPQNNFQTSIVSLPKVFPKEFVLYIKTNNVNRAQENSFTLSDQKGTVFYAENNFDDSTEYKFPMKLKNGSYQFLFKDDLEDGISRHWWYRNSTPEKIGINGEVRFLNMTGDTLHAFKPDFGQELLFNFHVGKIP